jgi:hypothetical protein
MGVCDGQNAQGILRFQVSCVELGPLNIGALRPNVNFSGAFCCLVNSWIRLVLPWVFNREYGPRLDGVTAREIPPSPFDGC